MVHGMRWAALRAAGGGVFVGCGSMGGGVVSIVMGLDQHRAQISAEWIDTITGEVFRREDRAGGPGRGPEVLGAVPG